MSELHIVSSQTVSDGRQHENLGHFFDTPWQTPESPAGPPHELTALLKLILSRLDQIEAKLSRPA